MPAGKFNPLNASIQTDLPGESVDLDPGNPVSLFTQSYDDLETLLAAHRFACVTVAGDAPDPDWVGVLWNAWLDRFVGRGWKTSGSAVMSHN